MARRLHQYVVPHHFPHLSVDESLVAGNYGTDTAHLSPANVASVIVVGAIDNNKNKAGFSNYGPKITVFGPGVDIQSTWYAACSRCELMERLTFQF